VVIRGAVNAQREAIIRVRLRGPTGLEADFDAVIDTGFNGAMTLPSTDIAALLLRRRLAGRASLADGSTRQFGVYDAEIWWDGTWRRIVISGLGEETLVGMAVLAEHTLRIDVRPMGAVEIDPLP
jgi:predicted aspartyl protease